MKTCRCCARFTYCLRTGNVVVDAVGDRICENFTPSVRSQKPEFQKETLYVKAKCESDGSIVEGIPDVSWNIECVRDCKTRQNRVVFDWSVCKRTGVTDKDGIPLYEYDLLELSKFGSKPSYGFLVWSDFYRRYVIKRSLEYSGHCNVEDFTIKAIGNVLLNELDEFMIVRQDDTEKKSNAAIDSSYCPSKFKR